MEELPAGPGPDGPLGPADAEGGGPELPRLIDGCVWWGVA